MQRHCAPSCGTCHQLSSKPQPSNDVTAKGTASDDNEEKETAKGVQVDPQKGEGDQKNNKQSTVGKTNKASTLSGNEKRRIEVSKETKPNNLQVEDGKMRQGLTNNTIATIEARRRSIDDKERNTKQTREKTAPTNRKVKNSKDMVKEVRSIDIAWGKSQVIIDAAPEDIESVIAAMNEYMNTVVTVQDEYTDIKDECRCRHERCSYWAAYGELYKPKCWMFDSMVASIHGVVR